jgi:tetratricopeptide (TPR) repeat protein
VGASPYGAAPAPPPVAAAPDRFDGLMDRPSPGSRALVATLTALVVLGVLAGGGWVVSRAFVNYAAQARADQEKARLGAAMRLFERGQFEQAADAFHRLRDSPSTEVRARAPLYESYCYRSLGNRMIRTDLAEAERLFRLAFGSASEAVRRAPSDRDAQAEYTQARSQLGDVLRARGAAPRREQCAVRPSRARWHDTAPRRRDRPEQRQCSGRERAAKLNAGPVEPGPAAPAIRRRGVEARRRGPGAALLGPGRADRSRLAGRHDRAGPPQPV